MTVHITSISPVIHDGDTPGWIATCLCGWKRDTATKEQAAYVAGKHA